MKICEGMVLRSLAGCFIVTGDGRSPVDFSKVISLNETAAYLWNEVKDKEFTVDDLTALLTARYEVDEATAKADAQKLTDTWREAGLLEG
ncbi:MAG: PqqD family protein [Bacteroidales bacterium]|nr:PqqD family protein [Bacteroidales bacterium]